MIDLKFGEPEDHSREGVITRKLAEERQKVRGLNVALAAAQKAADERGASHRADMEKCLGGAAHAQRLAEQRFSSLKQLGEFIDRTRSTLLAALPGASGFTTVDRLAKDVVEKIGEQSACINNLRRELAETIERADQNLRSYEHANTLVNIKQRKIEELQQELGRQTHTVLGARPDLQKQIDALNTRVNGLLAENAILKRNAQMKAWADSRGGAAVKAAWAAHEGAKAADAGKDMAAAERYVPAGEGVEVANTAAAAAAEVNLKHEHQKFLLDRALDRVFDRPFAGVRWVAFDRGFAPDNTSALNDCINAVIKAHPDGFALKTLFKEVERRGIGLPGDAERVRKALSHRNFVRCTSPVDGSVRYERLGALSLKQQVTALALCNRLLHGCDPEALALGGSMVPMAYLANRLGGMAEGESVAADWMAPTRKRCAVREVLEGLGFKQVSGSQDGHNLKAQVWIRRG